MIIENDLFLMQKKIKLSLLDILQLCKTFDVFHQR